MKFSSSVFDDVVDFDFTSLYPSIIRIFNIYKATLIGQLIILDNHVGVREKRVADDRYSRAAKFLEDLESQEAIHICYRWFNLPSAVDTLKYFESFLGEKAYKHIFIKNFVIILFNLYLS